MAKKQAMVCIVMSPRVMYLLGINLLLYTIKAMSKVTYYCPNVDGYIHIQAFTFYVLEKKKDLREELKILEARLGCNSIFKIRKCVSSSQLDIQEVIAL